MPAVKKLNVEGVEQGTVELNEKVFGAAPNEPLVHDVVVALQANKRQGTHKTKTRAEVRGGGVKPFRQKGTGRARRGSIREPHLRGGGTVFGPVPRSYRQELPVRVRRQALCCVLSERVRGERLSVIAGLQIETPKTKPVAQMLSKVAPEGRKTLLVTAGNSEPLLLSGRNIERLTLRTAADLNALDVLNAFRVVIQEEAVQQLEERLG